VGVARLLLDKGADIDEQDDSGSTALLYACMNGRVPMVRLLLEKGADPTIASAQGWIPLTRAAVKGHLEVVRLLLAHPRARVTINRRDDNGQTALWWACFWGRGGVAKALLESGADPTIADDDGTTPMVIAKRDPPPHIDDISAEGRRECVAALEVRSCFPPPSLGTPPLRSVV
jgi:ankyrin repeat protein